MSLISKFRKTYIVKVKCANCGKKCELQIKKGTTVQETIAERDLKCDSCYCDIEPTEYSTEWEK